MERFNLHKLFMQNSSRFSATGHRHERRLDGANLINYIFQQDVIAVVFYPRLLHVPMQFSAHHQRNVYLSKSGARGLIILGSHNLRVRGSRRD